MSNNTNKDDYIMPTNISQATDEITGIWAEEILNGKYNYVPCLRGGRGCGKTYAYEIILAHSNLSNSSAVA